MRNALLCVALTFFAPKIQAQEMVNIPAGAFTMGSETGDADERPLHKVELARFSIDRFEVTQAQYQRCVEAGYCRRAKQYPDNIGSKLPVVGVTWGDASRYCDWAGKRLPTEAEWERAAKGTDARTYPWGAGLQCAKANFGSFLGDGPCSGINPGRILPVGSRKAGASPAGVQDMAGNVWEWVADVYKPYARVEPSKKHSAPSPQGPGVNLSAREKLPRVVRGGSCCSYFAMPTTTNRLFFPEDYLDGDMGFRCAR
jgi:formylglycine-generating enzyme required for sulfatase activity